MSPIILGIVMLGYISGTSYWFKFCDGMAEKYNWSVYTGFAVNLTVPILALGVIFQILQ